MSRRTKLESRILNTGKKAVLPLAAAAAITIGGYVGKAKGDTHYLNPTTHPTTQSIQDEINASEPNDTISFATGTYTQGNLESYNFLANRNYTFNNAIINGHNDGGSIIQMTTGGNINISGPLTLQNSSNGIGIGVVPYNNININGVTFYVSDSGVHLEDIPHPTPLIEPAVNLRNCIAVGGKKIVKNEGVLSLVTNKYPFAGVANSTLTDLTSTGGAIDIPLTDTLELLGNNDILNLVIINSKAMSIPTFFQYFHSPNDVAQLYVESPLITGVDYGGGPFTGDRCFVADANEFLLDPYGYLTPIPSRNSRMNLGDGKYDGAYTPRDLFANINGDEFVDYKDARKFFENWLKVGIRYSEGDFNDDGIISFPDYSIFIKAFASEFGMEEPYDPNGILKPIE